MGKGPETYHTIVFAVVFFHPVDSIQLRVLCRRFIYLMSLVVISSDNYPGFSKRGTEFPRGKGIPKCPPEISINSHAIVI